LPRTRPTVVPRHGWRRSASLDAVVLAVASTEARVDGRLSRLHVSSATGSPGDPRQATASPAGLPESAWPALPPQPGARARGVRRRTERVHQTDSGVPGFGYHGRMRAAGPLTIAVLTAAGRMVACGSASVPSQPATVPSPSPVSEVDGGTFPEPDGGAREATQPPPAGRECTWDECSRAGHCTLSDGRCVAASDADCRNAEPCRLEGRCSARGGECRALTDADCERGYDCTNYARAPRAMASAGFELGPTPIAVVARGKSRRPPVQSSAPVWLGTDCAWPLKRDTAARRGGAETEPCAPSSRERALPARTRNANGPMRVGALADAPRSTARAWPLPTPIVRAPSCVGIAATARPTTASALPARTPPAVRRRAAESQEYAAHTRGGVSLAPTQTSSSPRIAGCTGSAHCAQAVAQRSPIQTATPPARVGRTVTAPRSAMAAAS